MNKSRMKIVCFAMIVILMIDGPGDWGDDPIIDPDDDIIW